MQPKRFRPLPSDNDDSSSNEYQMEDQSSSSDGRASSKLAKTTRCYIASTPPSKAWTVVDEVNGMRKIRWCGWRDCCMKSIRQSLRLEGNASIANPRRIGTLKAMTSALRLFLNHIHASLCGRQRHCWLCYHRGRCRADKRDTKENEPLELGV